MLNEDVFRWLNFFGWWPLNGKTERKKTLFRYYGYALFLSNVIQLCCEFVSLYFHLQEGSFKKIILNINTTMEGTWCAIKLSNLMLKEEAILSLIQRNGNLERIGRQEIGDKKTDELTQNGRRNNRILWILSKGGIACTAHWVSTPLFLTFIGDKKIISIDSYIPWSNDTWTKYGLTMTIQTVHVFSAMAGLFLSNYISSSILGALEINYILLGEMYSKLDFQNEKNSLKKCVEFHVELFDLTKGYNKIYGKIEQFECIVVIIVCCLCVVDGTSEVSHTFARVFNLCELAGCTLIFAFYECFLCDQVVVAAGNVTRSIYNNNWYRASIKDRKSLSIILERTKKLPSFGGAFAQTNLETFINMLKSIFSFYNFIKAMDSLI